MDLDTIKDYLQKFRGNEIDKEILNHLGRLKKLEVEQGNEIGAKEIWCLEQVWKVIYSYLMAFNNLRNKKHFDAWRYFERSEIELSFLRKHLDFENNLYNLKFYDRIINQFQSLFPYRYFMSRESIIKKASCSICKQPISIRNPCGHRLGEIYNGELCVRIVEDVELIGIAIVKNPVDKYTVLFTEGMEYDYSVLDNLVSQLTGPFDDWQLEIIKKKKPEYIGVGRNAPCPCNSGNKYKRCCLGTQKELYDHFKISLRNPARRILEHTEYTWKC